MMTVQSWAGFWTPGSVMLMTPWLTHEKSRPMIVAMKLLLIHFQPILQFIVPKFLWFPLIYFPWKYVIPFYSFPHWSYEPVFRIHDILVWIRIQIHGYMPLTNGSGFGSGSFYFHHWPSRCQQKTNFKKKFSLLQGTCTSFLKIKS